MRTITLFKLGNTWSFSDPDYEVRDEPFFPSACDLIDKMLEEEGHERTYRCQITFDDEPFKDAQFSLGVIREEPQGGATYWSYDFGKEGYLCDVLYKYYPEAPSFLFLHIGV